MAYTATLHYSDQDTTVGRYDEIEIDLLETFTGYGSRVLKILGPYENTLLEGDARTDIIGQKSGPNRTRRAFEIRYEPVTYGASDWDINEERILATILRKKYTWLELTAYEAAASPALSYHGDGFAIPIAIMGKSTEDNENGTKSIILSCEMRFREALPFVQVEL
jgi:hypothetical protein